MRDKRETSCKAQKLKRDRRHIMYKEIFHRGLEFKLDRN